MLLAVDLLCLFPVNNQFYPFVGVYTTTSLPEGSQVYRKCSIWQKGAWL